MAMEKRRKVMLQSIGFVLAAGLGFAIGCGGNETKSNDGGPPSSTANDATGPGVKACGFTETGWGQYSSMVVGTIYQNAEQACDRCKSNLKANAAGWYSTYSCDPACQANGSRCTAKVTTGTPTFDCQVFQEPDEFSSITRVSCSSLVTSTFSCNSTGCDSTCCKARQTCSNGACTDQRCLCKYGENYSQSGCVTDGGACSALHGILVGCPDPSCPASQ
jgi:hypothetical protein